MRPPRVSVRRRSKRLRRRGPAREAAAARSPVATRREPAAATGAEPVERLVGLRAHAQLSVGDPRTDRIAIGHEPFRARALDGHSAKPLAASARAAAPGGHLHGQDEREVNQQVEEELLPEVPCVNDRAIATCDRRSASAARATRTASRSARQRRSRAERPRRGRPGARREPSPSHVERRSDQARNAGGSRPAASSAQRSRTASRCRISRSRRGRRSGAAASPPGGRARASTRRGHTGCRHARAAAIVSAEIIDVRPPARQAPVRPDQARNSTGPPVRGAARRRRGEEVGVPSSSLRPVSATATVATPIAPAPSATSASR